MNKNETLKLAQWAIDSAQQEGAQQVSLSIYAYKSTEIELRNGEVENLENALEAGLSISLYVDGKYSNHSTNKLEKTSLVNFITEAVKATRHLHQDPYRSLPEPARYFKKTDQTPNLKLYDPAFETITIEDKMTLVHQTNGVTEGLDKRMINANVSYNDSQSCLLKLHSNGFEAWKEHTRYSVGVSVTVDGGESRPQDYDYKSSVFFKELDTSKLGENALARALAKIGAKPAATNNYQLLLENRVVSRLLGGLFTALKGSSLAQKSSFLEDCLGKKITSSKLSIMDNPLIASSSGSRHFDAEGMQATVRPILDKGVLQTYYLDTYNAKKLGAEPTTGSSSNLVFSKGEASLDQLVKQLDKGILVTELNGGNSNSTTGDFSYGIGGFLIENGKRTKPISGMILTDNHKEFWHKLKEIGSDSLDEKAWKTPSMLFESVACSGI